jgi:hypothetical protein
VFEQLFEPALAGVTSTPTSVKASPIGGRLQGPGSSGVELADGDYHVGGCGMRRYDDPVEVRKGMVGGTEGPEQFLWRGRLWKVCDVVAHWMETGPWWQSPGMRAVLGSEEAGPAEEREAVTYDLAAEREVWRVEAARGLAATGTGRGVFDLVFDWAEGSWQLVRCLD